MPLTIIPANVYHSETWTKAIPGVEQDALRDDAFAFGQDFFNSFDLMSMFCGVDVVKSGQSGFLGKEKTEAFIVGENFRSYKWYSIHTVHFFGSICVVGHYKQLDGGALFESSDDVEEKRTRLMQKLGDIESLDLFAAVEYAFDSTNTAIIQYIEEITSQD